MPESVLYYYLPQSQQDVTAILKTLESEGKIVRWDTSSRTPLVSDAARTTEAKQRIRDALAAFHEAQPLLAGQNASQLCRQLALDKLGFEKLTEALIAEAHLVKEGNLLRLASHEIQFSEEEENAKEKLEQLFFEAGINTPTLKEVLKQLSDMSVHQTPRVIESTFFALVKLGRFVKIDDKFLRSQTGF